MIGRLSRAARVCGTAIDARAVRRSDDAAALAAAAGWIASNVLAARGVRVDDDRRRGADLPPLPAPEVIDVRTHDLGGLLAAVAQVPALIDGDTLPAGWRLALRALGMPLLDRPPAVALAGGASIAILGEAVDGAPESDTSPYPLLPSRRVAIGADPLGYRVRSAPAVDALPSAT